MSLESRIQTTIIEEIGEIIPDCVVIKTDPTYIQGFPDLLILFDGGWLSLEVKRSENSPRRPNQEYWVDVLDHLSFSRFIYPENKEEVYREIQRTFGI